MTKMRRQIASEWATDATVRELTRRLRGIEALVRALQLARDEVRRAREARSGGVWAAEQNLERALEALEAYSFDRTPRSKRCD